MSNVWSAIEFAPVSRYSSVSFVIDGNNDVIDTGLQGWIPIPFDGIIDEVTLLADQTGSIQIDIWKDTYGNYQPTNADSITASAEPEIVAGIKSQDSTLTGWTTAVSEGDILAFNVDSVSTIEKVTITLKIART